jgi:GT2 family glycosyltransferase
MRPDGPGTGRKKARSHRVDRAMTGVSIPRAAKGATATPTITAVVGAYNAEQYIGETIESLLAQTRPPDEIIVVDDGSTDSTRAILDSFGGRIRVVDQTNGGCPAAFNRAFSEAMCDYVGMCGADDLWAAAKLEQQAAALEAHPEIDVAFGGSRSFGAADAPWPDPPGEGIMDSERLMDELFRENIICASSILVRRSLWQQLGPFLEQVNGERFACDDYEYWLRALGHGAVFHYGPGLHTLYRRHGSNATLAQSWVCRSRTATHLLHANAVADQELVREILASDLRLQARAEIEDGDMIRARSSFLGSMRHERNLRALAFVMLLSLPATWSRRLIGGWVALRPTILRTVARFTRLRGRSSTVQEGASA